MIASISHTRMLMNEKKLRVYCLLTLLSHLTRNRELDPDLHGMNESDQD